MMFSLSVQFWLIIQIVLDLCLVTLFIVFVRQVRTMSANLGSNLGLQETEEVANTLESVLKDAKDVAGQFEVQLNEKKCIAKRLNEQLDSRIISLNLLLNRAEARLESNDIAVDGNSKSHKDVHHLQHEIIALSEKGDTPGKIADRLGVIKGEVELVLDLKKKFQDIEQV